MIVSLYSSGVLGAMLSSPIQVRHQKTGASTAKDLKDEKVAGVRQEAIDIGKNTINLI